MINSTREILSANGIFNSTISRWRAAPESSGKRLRSLAPGWRLRVEPDVALVSVVTSTLEVGEESRATALSLNSANRPVVLAIIIDLDAAFFEAKADTTLAFKVMPSLTTSFSIGAVSIRKDVGGSWVDIAHLNKRTMTIQRDDWVNLPVVLGDQMALAEAARESIRTGDRLVLRIRAPEQIVDCAIGGLHFARSKQPGEFAQSAINEHGHDAPNPIQYLAASPAKTIIGDLLKRPDEKFWREELTALRKRKEHHIVADLLRYLDGSSVAETLDADAVFEARSQAAKALFSLRSEPQAISVFEDLLRSSSFQRADTKTRARLRREFASALLRGGRSDEGLDILRELCRASPRAWDCGFGWQERSPRWTPDRHSLRSRRRNRFARQRTPSSYCSRVC